MSDKKALLLFSGGLDSTVCLAHLVEGGYDVVAVNFQYGQRHAREIHSALAIADYFGVEMLLSEIPLLVGARGSSLTDRSIEVSATAKGTLPSSYVPGRNMIFLALAASYAEAHGISNIITGVNALDYDGYPDCRPVFIRAMRDAIRSGTRAGDGLNIATPLIHLNKAEIITLGTECDTPFGLSWSCYEGRDVHCGVCDACTVRKNGFIQAGEQDPTRYEA